MAYEVLMGLHYLHGFKVVMLDLKSPNVLLAADGTAKLADVGLARLMSVTSLSHKIPTGTWAWAAPEALLGNKVTQPASTAQLILASDSWISSAVRSGPVLQWRVQSGLPM